MKIKAFASRYDLTRGEGPGVLIQPEKAEDWYGRDPFDDAQVEGVSSSLMMDPLGTTDGHNLMLDTTFTASMRMDKWVPLSPLFVKDLTGRIIYIGFGPERKGNLEWEAYFPNPGTATAPADEVNPFLPMRTFPRFCRDVDGMEGEDLLEQVFLTKFRCLEMSDGYHGMISGASEDDELVCATYQGANLYPYKLRLDTFYGDGWKLPQTVMVYARGEAEGITAANARRLADQFMMAWKNRTPGMSYADWFEALGEEQVEKLYKAGCTVIPTFEACNGYHVVGPNFELEDYWPGQAVLGLHDVVERRGDKAPAGTILDVLEPGYVTATMVQPAKVVVSDGTGYVSPNAADPSPLVPNLYLPHTRALDDWRATWIPTHPEHFEAPAIWGWELEVGRFMQLSGPLWDPLHYFYESVDVVLKAFDKYPVSEAQPLVPVPEEMERRFYPVIPMKGFDTFSDEAYRKRRERGVKPESCLARVPTQDYTVGIGYHPLPAEFEFELDPFWFPEMHPLNRDQGITPNDVGERIVPIITPRVAVSTFLPTVNAPELAAWWNDEGLMESPRVDPMMNYPQLVRYLIPDLKLEEVIALCPTPYLGNPTFDLAKPIMAWWMDEDGVQIDGPLAMEDAVPGTYDALWDMRQKGGDVVKFRHLVYRTNLPLYNLAWWYGWGIKDLEEAMQQWIETAEVPNESAA